jgi:hypothetical protein
MNRRPRILFWLVVAAGFVAWYWHLDFPDALGLTVAAACAGALLWLVWTAARAIRRNRRRRQPDAPWTTTADLQRLLREVDAGRVYGRHVAGLPDAVWSFVLRDDGRGPGEHVTTRMNDLAADGLVELGPDRLHYCRRQWQLTERGRSALMQNEPGA